jgi:para-aminobenzoate N-oxygenase AurF
MLTRLPTRAHRDEAWQALEATWGAPIDRTRWFLCETLTPLYYTRAYAELEPEVRLRYNQLTGILANELIELLETEFLRSALRAVRRDASVGADLLTAAAEFEDDERRHADVWRRLNRLSEPSWYRGGGPHVVCAPGWIRAAARFIARHSTAFPVVFWIQLAQEERSVDISRRCARVDPMRIEPRYAAAYAAHVRDEVRHVQIDRQLIERFYAARPAAVRHTTAVLFRHLIRRFLLVPAASTLRVLELLAREFPIVNRYIPRIRRELSQLAASDAYHSMMYSRRTTPVLFALFDRFPEFHPMQHVLRAYMPRPHPGA